MRRIKNRIKSWIASQIFLGVLEIFPRLSNKGLIRLIYIAQNILSRNDVIVEKVMSELRRYFKQDNHPFLGLIRRILRDLNPKCKNRLMKNFFVNAVFKGVSKSKEYADKEGFVPPWFIVLSPTMRCNLSCLGCSTRRYTKDDDLPIPIIDRILNEAKQMGIHFIVTQGGEMFIYEEMWQVYEKHKDIYFQVYTNGTLIDKKTAKRIARLGNIAPMVSLEGFKETTDYRRGKGVFDKAIQAMDNLRQEGCFFGASVTHTRHNSEEITSDAFFEMLFKKGCYVIWFFQFVPVGKDPDLGLMPTPHQRNRLRQKVSKIRERLPIFIGDFWNDGPFVGGCIAAGRRYIHINNKGDVEPCAFVHFAVDNIKNKTLKEALNSDFFKFLRKKQPFGDGNLFTPCMIIDNPEVLREAVRLTGAKPTHEDAELILNGRLKDGLNEYARQMHRLTEPFWNAIKDKIIKWPY
ncbi:MAG: radical SAM protein [Candidatus Omnitrophica bacterium]|nr:radical SAM protein [Candidatus Omnitrophota bacterium]